MSTQEFRNFTVRVPKDLYAKLAKLAEREYSSLNRETNIALRAHLDANGKKGSR